MPFFIKAFKTCFGDFAVVRIDPETGEPRPRAPTASPKKKPVTHYEVTRDRHGRRALIAHRDKLPTEAADNNAAGKPAAPPVAAEQSAVPAPAPAPIPAPIPAPNPAPLSVANLSLHNAKSARVDGEKKAVFTAEEDAKLKELKNTKGKSWKMIAEEMHKDVEDLKARWKEIQPAGGNAQAQGQKNEGGKKGGKGGNGGDKPQNNNNKHQKPAEANKKQHQQRNQKYEKPASPAKPASEREQETRFTMNDWLALTEDDLFSFGELQCLSEILAHDLQRNKNTNWLDIASRFYDITGRRVHKDDIREKFEAMAEKAHGGK